MKKNQFKNHLKLGILLCGALFLFTNCEDYNFEENLQNQDIDKLNLSWYKRDYQTVLKENESLNKHISNEFSLQKHGNTSKIYSEVYSFSINENLVQVISSDNFDSYTFLIERDTYEQDVLENYVYTLYSNGDYTQMIVSYPISYIDGETTYDISSATATFIEDEILITDGKSFSPCGNMTEEVVTWDQNAGECIEYNCTAGGNHSPGDSCNGSPSQQPYIECSGGWVVTDCVDFGGGSSGGPSGVPVGGGSGNTSNEPDDPNDNDEIPVIPLDDLGELGVALECIKIQDFLNTNPNFKTLLLALNDETNIDYEKSISKFENEPLIITSQGTSGEPEVIILNTPSEKYEAFAHYHYETTTTPEGDTESVFTINDLKTLAELLNNNYLDHREFVAFLSTGKGTHFALTIHNKSKFLNAFHYLLNPSPPDTNDFNVMTSWIDKKNKWLRLKEEFYDSKDSKIKATNNNNNQVLASFLRFLSKGNMGISVFKTDENFDEFTRVTYKPSEAYNIKERPCNN